VSLSFLQAEWNLSDEQVSDFKEVFMLFDKDEDGVLTFPELNVVMKSLGQRPSGKYMKFLFKGIYLCQKYHLSCFWKHRIHRKLSKRTFIVLTYYILIFAYVFIYACHYFIIMITSFQQIE
jgi:hypothetical protein